VGMGRLIAPPREENPFTTEGSEDFLTDAAGDFADSVPKALGCTLCSSVPSVVTSFVFF
jgi:hypothetical protein